MGRTLWRTCGESAGDNHVDAELLQSLTRTEAGKQLPLLACVLGGCAVAWQGTTVVALFTLHAALLREDGPISPAALLGANAAALALVLASGRVSVGVSEWAALGATAAVLTPVIQSLGSAFEADSLEGLAGALAALHLLSHDYAGLPRVRGPALSSSDSASAGPMRLSAESALRGGIVSLNAAVFAASLLASRQASLARACILVLTAVQLFVLLPLVRDGLRRDAPWGFVAATAVAVVGVAWALVEAAPFLALCAAATVMCPLLYYAVQAGIKRPVGAWDCAEEAPSSS
jgi:hypothetical protein